MGIEFLNKITATGATIPPDAFRIAGFILVVQAILLFLQKKNSPSKSIWEDLSGILMAGLFVFLFPELIKCTELVINSACSVDSNQNSAILNYITSSNQEVEEGAEGGTWSNILSIIQSFFLKSTVQGIGNPVSYLFAVLILKPVAEFINVLCFPTYWIIRAISLNIIYWIAPFILMVGAIPAFRSLWKQWFLIYAALLVCGPALVIANNFCELAFSLYVNETNSPILGFFIIALARFAAFKAVVDLCYRIFRA